MLSSPAVPSLSDLFEKFDLDDSDDLQILSDIANGIAENPTEFVIQMRQRLIEKAAELNLCPGCFSVMEHVGWGKYECYGGCGYRRVYENAV